MNLEKVEPIIYVLSVMIIFFSGLLIYCEHMFPNDGQVFQVFSGILTALSGALMMRVKPAKSEDSSVNIGNNVIGTPPKIDAEQTPPIK